MFNLIEIKVKRYSSKYFWLCIIFEFQFLYDKNMSETFDSSKINFVRVIIIKYFQYFFYRSIFLYFSIHIEYREEVDIQSINY